MQIYVHRDGQQFGPYSIEQARDYLESGNLVADDLAWYDDTVDWVPLGEVPGMLDRPAAAPVRSSAPDWVPPRRDTTSVATSALPGQVARNSPITNTFTTPVQPSPTQAASPSVAPSNVPPTAPKASAPRGGDPYARAQRAVGLRNMGIGGLFCVGGTAVTVISYEAAVQSSGDRTYFMAWGAILFGGIQFIRGVIQFCRG